MIDLPWLLISSRSSSQEMTVLCELSILPDAVKTVLRSTRETGHPGSCANASSMPPEARPGPGPAPLRRRPGPAEDSSAEEAPTGSVEGGSSGRTPGPADVGRLGSETPPVRDGPRRDSSGFPGRGIDDIGQECRGSAISRGPSATEGIRRERGGSEFGGSVDSTSLTNPQPSVKLSEVPHCKTFLGAGKGQMREISSNRAR